MKKLLVALLLAALMLPPVASATNFYVNSGTLGRDTNLGTSATAPKKTLAGLKAGANSGVGLLPGDSVYVAGGPTGYTWVSVDSAGSNPTAGGYIAFFSTGTQRATLTSGFTLANPYVTMQGFQAGGDIAFSEAADRCRVVDCNATGNVYFNGADYSSVVGGTFNGPYIRIAYQGGSVDRDSLNGVAFPFLGDPNATSNYIVYCGQNDAGGLVADSVVVFNCNITETCYAPTAEYWSEFFVRTTNLRWVGNHTTATIEQGGFWKRRQRDNSHGNTFERDTVIVTGPGEAAFFMATYGSGAGPVYATVVDSSYYNFLGATGAYEGLWFHSDGMHSVSITRTTVLTHGHAVEANSADGHSLIDHCTLVSDGLAGVCNFADKGPQDVAFQDSALTFTNNIVRSLPPDMQNQCMGILSNGSCIESYHPNDHKVGMFYSKSLIDSAGVGRYQRGVFAHNNLYDVGSFSHTAGDCDISIWDADYVRYAAPGDNTATENAAGLDSIGTNGSAAFVSEDLAAFDPHLLSTSAAIGHDASGGDIGACAYTSVAEVPFATVWPPIVFFTFGIRSEAEVSITNTGDATLSLSKVCERGVHAVTPPTFGPYTKPTSLYTDGLGWSDAANEGQPDPSDGLGNGTDPGGAPAIVRFYYDGTGARGIRHFYVLTNDPRVPVSSPPGCATAGRWLDIPIYIDYLVSP